MTANPDKAPIYAGDWSKSAGKPYRPSNGTEGDMFIGMWCRGCERDRAFREERGDSCPIVAMTFCVNTDDPDYPKEWRYDAVGVPECTAWEPVDASAVTRPPPDLDEASGRPNK